MFHSFITYYKMAPLNDIYIFGENSVVISLQWVLKVNLTLPTVGCHYSWLTFMVNQDLLWSTTMVDRELLWSTVRVKYGILDYDFCPNKSYVVFRLIIIWFALLSSQPDCVLPILCMHYKYVKSITNKFFNLSTLFFEHVGHICLQLLFINIITNNNLSL